MLNEEDPTWLEWFSKWISEYAQRGRHAALLSATAVGAGAPTLPFGKWLSRNTIGGSIYIVSRHSISRTRTSRIRVPTAGRSQGG